MDEAGIGYSDETTEVFSLHLIADFEAETAHEVRRLGSVPASKRAQGTKFA